MVLALFILKRPLTLSTRWADDSGTSGHGVPLSSNVFMGEGIPIVSASTYISTVHMMYAFKAENLHLTADFLVICMWFKQVADNPTTF